MAKQDHITEEDLEKRHQDGKKAREKGCLTRCKGRIDGNECSHQWQAGKQAKADSGLYSGHPGFKNKSTLINGTSYAHWDHFMAPFWHNAHHMIPNGAFNNSIVKAGKNLANVIKIGLLRATYNLNDQVNMIILPLKMEDAVVLRLPRHLTGDEVGPGEQPEFQSHIKYSKQAEIKLKPIMDDYKQLAEEAVESVEGTHKQPRPKLSKAKLEALSKNIYKAIKAVGQSGTGESLSQLGKKIFKAATAS